MLTPTKGIESRLKIIIIQEKIKMIKDSFYDVLEQLLTDKYFSEFQYRKRDCRLIRIDTQGFEAIEFQYWDGFDLLRDKRAMVVKPLYLKRFDVLHQWFEKFSFKTKSDQRDNYSIGFDGSMLEKQNEFYFLLDKDDRQKDIERLKKEIITNSTNIFNKFGNLKALYEYQINPILNHQMKLPDVGADWVFEYLTLSKIVQPGKYLNLKDIISKQVQLMNGKNEPNIIEYYPRFKEITEYLEAQQLR